MGTLVFHEVVFRTGPYHPVFQDLRGQNDEDEAGLQERVDLPIVQYGSDDGE